MTLDELLREYDLSDDDIRWSLSLRMAESMALLLEQEGLEAVARRFWSGETADALYDLVERWIRGRGDQLERGILDEGHLRDELSGMTADRISRRRN